MTMLRRVTGQVRLFLCCYVNVPLQGGSDGLEHKSLPIWALMRTGEIDTNRGDEYIVGLNRSSRLQPTIVSDSCGLSNASKDDFQLTFAKLPKVLKKKISKLHNTPLFIEQRVTSAGFDSSNNRYGAVLLHLDDLRQLPFKNEDGFGVFMDLKNLNDVVERQKREKKKWEALITQKRRFSFSLQTYSLQSTKLTLDLHASLEDIKFVQTAIMKWKAESRDKREAQWKKAMSRVIG